MNDLQTAQLTQARKRIIVGLLALITSADYDPTIEPAEFGKLIDEVTAIPGYDFLKLVTALHHEKVTGLPFKRDLKAELRELTCAMFGMAAPEQPDQISATAADPDQRFVGKHPSLGTPYEAEVAPEDIQKSFIATANAIESNGYPLSEEKKAELRTTVENVITSGEPQRFDVKDGVAMMVGSTRADLDKFHAAVDKERANSLREDPLGAFLAALLSAGSDKHR